MPKDTVCSSPKGWPSASTNSPTRSRFESPSGGDGQPGGLDLDQRQVHALVLPDEPALEAAAVGQLDLDALGVGDDVLVGDEVAVLADEEARARAAPLVGRRRLLALGLGLGGAAHADLHQRRLEPLGEAVHVVVEPGDLGRRRAPWLSFQSGSAAPTGLTEIKISAAAPSGPADTRLSAAAPRRLRDFLIGATAPRPSPIRRRR